jgi:hypothetical protein
MDAGMTFSRGIADRYFEDYVEGEVHRFGTIAVEADEMIAFAKRFDPQAMHTDPEAAKHTPFGGLIASGWYTAALVMRLYVEHYLTHVASLASPARAHDFRRQWLRLQLFGHAHRQHVPRAHRLKPTQLVAHARRRLICCLPMQSLH